MKILWILTALSSVLGALMFLVSMAITGGVGQAAGFAGAIALAVVPYVFTRCVQALVEPTQATMFNAVVAAFEKKS